MNDVVQERRCAPRVSDGNMADLSKLVHNYNETQGMACVAIRMDPYTPCNGTHGRLCMQCPRKKGLALVVTPIPG
jgi:hypothetical protein